MVESKWRARLKAWRGRPEFSPLVHEPSTPNRAGIMVESAGITFPGVTKVFGSSTDIFAIHNKVPHTLNPHHLATTRTSRDSPTPRDHLASQPLPVPIHRHVPLLTTTKCSPRDIPGSLPDIRPRASPTPREIHAVEVGAMGQILLWVGLFVNALAYIRC